jgi:hypothetical protein
LRKSQFFRARHSIRITLATSTTATRCLAHSLVPDPLSAGFLASASMSHAPARST